jgi:dihydrofolate reductase
MRKLIYSMTVSLDGFIAGPDGQIDWSAPDEELHRFHNGRVRELGAHLLGRRLYEAMVYWETADENPSLRDFELEFARILRCNTTSTSTTTSPSASSWSGSGTPRRSSSTLRTLAT